MNLKKDIGRKAEKNLHTRTYICRFITTGISINFSFYIFIKSDQIN
jgi:hypothetical protein